MTDFEWSFVCVSGRMRFVGATKADFARIFVAPEDAHLSCVKFRFGNVSFFVPDDTIVIGSSPDSEAALCKAFADVAREMGSRRLRDFRIDCSCASITFPFRLDIPEVRAALRTLRDDSGDIDYASVQMFGATVLVQDYGYAIVTIPSGPANLARIVHSVGSHLATFRGNDIADRVSEMKLA